MSTTQKRTHREIDELKRAFLMGSLVAANIGGTAMPYASLSSVILYGIAAQRQTTVGGTVIG